MDFMNKVKHTTDRFVILSKIVSLILCFILILAAPCKVSATIGFEDVTQKAGIHNRIPTAASAWADLWVSNHHMTPPSLYLNQKNGTFVDVAADILIGKPRADFHGAAWADFDNDGDQDLIVTTGAGAGRGRSPNYLLDEGVHHCGSTRIAMGNWIYC